MASPFSMMSIINRARRSSQKKVSTEDVASSPIHSRSGSKKSKSRKSILVPLPPPEHKVDPEVIARDSGPEDPSHLLSSSGSSTLEPSFSIVHQPETHKISEFDWTEVEEGDNKEEKNAQEHPEDVLALDENGDIESLERRSVVNGEKKPEHENDIEKSVGKSGSEDLQRIQDLENELSLARGELESRTNHINALEAELSERSMQLAKAEEDITRFAEEKKEKQDEIASLYRRQHETTLILGEVREEVEKMKKSRKTQDEKIQELGRDKLQLTRDMSRIQAELQKQYENLAYERRREVEQIEIADELKKDITRMEQEVAERINEIRMKDEQLGKFQSQRAGIEEQLNGMLHRVESAERRNRMLEDQMSRREGCLRGSQDLRSSREFSSSYEGFRIRRKRDQSEKTVIDLINSTNSEIFQAAAFIADSLDHDGVDASDDAKDTSVLLSRMNNVIGNNLMWILRSKYSLMVEDIDPLPIQVALQITMIYCCSRIITSWYPGHWEYSDFLATIWSRILRTEDAASAQEWKATTRAQFEPLDDSHLQMAEFLTSHLVDVLTVAGWSREVSEAKCRTPTCQLKLSVISDLALRLNTMLDASESGEKFELIIIPQGSPFNDKSMDDEYVDDNNPSFAVDGEEVIGTTFIGLQRQTRNHDGSSELEIVLRPQVVLRSVFE